MLALSAQVPAFQIANVVLPSEAEREERRAMHDKLDEIARTLAGRTDSERVAHTAHAGRRQFSHPYFISLAVADRRVFPIRA
jgi:hypothetical protein